MKRSTRPLPCTKLLLRRVIWFGVYLALGIVVTAVSGEISGETLRFRSLGQPTADKVEAARKINELMLFEDRLYLGHGDWFKNTGPTDVIYYDFPQKKFVKEHSVDEEAIHRYRHYGNRLFLPGTDATENSEFGDLYVHDAAGWKKFRTIPRGLHVFDFAEYAGRWYVATGSYFDDIKKGPWIGAIYSSQDQATSWRYEYITDAPISTVSRITSLMPYKGRLFAFGYQDGPMPQKSNSDPSSKVRQPNRVGKSVVFDGIGWFPADIIPKTPFVQTIEPFVFADQLLLSVRSGRYGEQFQNRWLLFAYDGENIRRVPLECDQIVDILVKEDRLILLLSQQGKYLLAETADLAHWKKHPLDAKISQPLSVEYDGNSYYLGLADGTVLAATLSAD